MGRRGLRLLLGGNQQRVFVGWRSYLCAIYAQNWCIKGALLLPVKEFSMSIRFNVVLSDDLNREIDKAAAETETNKSEILRKALQLFLVAREGKQRGLKLGLVEPKTERLQTEIVGL